MADILPEISRSYKARLHQRKRKKSDDNGCSWEVRSVKEKSGVGMFATSKISIGDVIISNESPIVSFINKNHRNFQSSSRGHYFCSYCACPINTLRYHLNMSCCSSAEKKKNMLPYLADESGPVFSKCPIICGKCEDVAWCSNACADKGKLNHSFLCQEHQALDEFYSTVPNPNIFHLATNVITIILTQLVGNNEEKDCSKAIKNGYDEKKLHWWKDYGSYPDWWEVGDPSNREQRREHSGIFCRYLVTSLLRKLNGNTTKKETLQAVQGTLLKLCRLDNIGKILGMLECNVMQFEYPSPVEQYIEHLEQDILEEGEEINNSDNEYSKMVGRHKDEDSREWILQHAKEKDLAKPLLGSGLYPLLTLANHDCDPNASIDFLQESNRGSMVALRNIKIGEEICITYVPNGDWDSSGGDDSGDRFRYFEPTRTWKWLNRRRQRTSNTSSEREEESVDECLGEKMEEEEDDDDDDEEGGSDRDEQSTESDIPEGLDQKERSKALLEYGFECQCSRCRMEVRSGNG